MQGTSPVLRAGRASQSVKPRMFGAEVVQRTIGFHQVAALGLVGYRVDGEKRNHSIARGAVCGVKGGGAPLAVWPWRLMAGPLVS